MNTDILAVIALVLAGIPAGLFLLNLAVYRRLPVAGPQSCRPDRLSVLIPARNEEANIGAALQSVLANPGVDFEVIVLDDQSTDRTGPIVQEIATRDSRVRLASALSLPPGWCGKPHACHALAELTEDPWLLFMDADVRLTPDALGRMMEFMHRRGVDLASGVPCQQLGTWSERLLLPLIHFILLGYLPMPPMRWTRHPAFSAGCGQLFIARAEAYFAAGGHAAIRATLHDGVMLPRLFRRAGFKTDLFDATDVAVCRMYRTNRQTWRGLGKNATEGLAAPRVIIPMTLLLLGGQVLPFALLAGGLGLTAFAQACTLAAMLLAWLPRLLGIYLFRQPALSALLHPIGIAGLLGLQWHALIQKQLGTPLQWKGRAYPVTGQARRRKTAVAASGWLFAALLAFCPVQAGESRPETGLASSPLRCPTISLEDQFKTAHRLTFPTTNLTVVIFADRKGSEQIGRWTADLKQRYGNLLTLIGVADVADVPGLLRNTIRLRFKEKYAHPILLDWDGDIARALPVRPKEPNLFLVSQSGTLLATEFGPASAEALQRLDAAITQSSSSPRVPASR